MADELTPELKIKLESIICVDGLSDNSILIFKVNDSSKAVVQSIQHIMDFYGDILEKKRCYIVAMKGDQKIEALSEKDMNALGWFKKEEKSLIIH